MLKRLGQRSCLFVLSGPCGTGKTSLAKAWRDAEPDLGYTHSVTTRQPRSEAEDHYDWVTREDFLEMVRAGQFVQWIHPTYDEYYGTRREPIDAALSHGSDLVFDYCPEGTINLVRAYPQAVVSIFIMAPSIEEMRRRLADRGTENFDEQKIRYRMALQDFNFVQQHDYHVINDDFASTLAILRSIRVAEKARVSRQIGLAENYARAAVPSLLRYYDAELT